MRGLAEDAAIERLCADLGLSPDAGEPPWERATAPGAETIQRRLRGVGIIARLVAMDPAAVRTVPLPILVRSREGGWLLVRRRWGHFLAVEGMKGKSRLSAGGLSAAASGTALEITPRLPLPGSLWKAVGAAVRREPRALGLVVTATLLAQVASLVPPQLTRLALDRALPHDGRALLGAIVVGGLLTGAFQLWITWVRQQALLFIRTRTQFILERGFLDHVLGLPFPRLHERTVGDLLQAMSGLGAARDLVTERALGVFLDGMTTVLYLAAMALTMPAPAAVVAASALLLAGAATRAGTISARLEEAEIAAEVVQRSFLIESLAGIATVKGMGAESSILRRWLSMLQVQFRASQSQGRSAMWADILLQTIRQAIMVLVLVWGGYSALAGKVTVGSLMAFVQMTSAFLVGVLSLTSAHALFLALRPRLAISTAIARLEPQRRVAPSPPPAGDTCIVMDDVWFRYREGSAWILDGYRLQVRKGQKHWIQGPSGSGKSTILRLLAGLYSPAQGQVVVAGRDPSRETASSLYLPQFVHLYSGTIFDNLRILSAYAARDRIFEAAQMSGLDRFVRTLPMGYDTIVPAGGGSISGGQRQLIALTAVMASDRPILFLDEPFSSLDSVSRSRVMDNEWLAERTIVYASHDTAIAAESARGGR